MSTQAPQDLGGPSGGATEAPPDLERPSGGATTAPGLSGPPTVGDLVARVSEQLSRILRGEIELIQVKLTDKLKNVGVGAGFFAVAGLMAFYGLATLIAAAVLGLAVALPAWLSALIIGVVLLIIAGIAALIGKNKAQKGEAPSPEETKANLKADVDAVKRGINS